jgi:hypothetical protein
MSIILAIIVLIAAVGAIYLLLRDMGQDGVEAAAPGSCKSGRCGVKSGQASGTSCQSEAVQLTEADEIKQKDVLLLSDGPEVITSPTERS